MQLHGIVLAAGKGKRMNSTDLPKVLHSLGGKPMLGYVIDTVREAGVADPIIVVGFLGQKIVDTFGNRYRYVWQRKRLGTAHAAKLAESYLKHEKGYTFILYGDNPLLGPTTLKRIVVEVLRRKATIGLSVAKAPDDLGLGIVATSLEMQIQEIVEQKVATADFARQHPWRNTGSWLVENQWLWQALPKIRKHPKSGEYYITDLAYLAHRARKLAIAVPVSDPAEAIGINTQEHLNEAEKWLATKRKE